MRTKVNIPAAFDDYHRAVFDFVYRLTCRADVAEDITYGPKESRQVRFATDRLENLLPKR